MNGIMIAIQCTAEGGDNVVIVGPLWPDFVGSIQIMGAEPHFAPLLRCTQLVWKREQAAEPSKGQCLGADPVQAKYTVVANTGART